MVALIALTVTVGPRACASAPSSTQTAQPQTPITPAAAVDPGASSPPAPAAAGAPAAQTDTRATPLALDTEPTDTVDDSPAERTPRSPSPGRAGSAAAAKAPGVVGENVAKARELLVRGGWRVRTRLVENRTAAPGLVQAQNVVVGSAAGDPPVVVLTAVAKSTLSIHYRQGDEQAAEALASHLRRLRSTSGSLIRTQQVTPRPEITGRVAFAEAALEEQAASIAKDASAFLGKTYGLGSRLEPTSNPRVALRAVILGLPAVGAR